ncbi:enoyl-CoA hydratase/isomerase family protein [Yinghuangia seranimata]|uniref:enoyl-CoA hydratase/isomerase family protein n=1 Tax=Yinghuangia seranimata TaxID=408067 RepID=UPI00248A98F9|nr:enoyl-CoA hydratase-related protein [Yinghuangia seranimata]MDI2125348.1 enoyl-CoA hydratase-related protein [Yinghuangia seranimata]
MTDAYRSAPGLRVEPDPESGLLRLTLDRAGKRNALDDGMVAGLIEALDTAGRDEAVRAVLLAADGPHFCTGADIVQRNAADETQGEGRRPRVGSIQRRLPSQAHRLIPLLLTVQVPVVCAVRGWAAGIGLALALASDVTVAADDARFWAPFAARGFTPDSGVTWLLPRRVGEVRARRMLLLGETVDGKTAQEWGLIERAVPGTGLETAAEELAHRLAAGPTVALGLTKWLLHNGGSATLEQQLRDEAFAMELSSRSRDFREGMAAFAAKRPADFQGR